MKTFILLFCGIFLSLLSSSAQAGVCSIQIQRTCKPDKPCRTSETQTLTASTSEECLSRASSLCTIYFSEAIQSKQVRANFDGKGIGGNLCR